MAFWGEYVSVASRRAQAEREVKKLRKQGHTVDPVSIEGNAIARTFWGKSWCRHLESFSDYASRLPRGRSYARHGAVCHLAVSSGVVEGIVSGSYLYQVRITVSPLPSDLWSDLKKRCSGQIASMLELLNGKLSKNVMTTVCDRALGLFPKPREIKLSCSCPDGARMCKHVAAVLYGVGNRLDRNPELLFQLRGVDPIELLATPVSVTSGVDENTLADDDLEALFGIELDLDVPSPAPQTKIASKAKKKTATKAKAGKKGAGKSKAVKKKSAGNKTKTPASRTSKAAKTQSKKS